MTKTLVHLDPSALQLGTNVRADTRLEAPFLASIEERGVLEPVLAHQEPDGTVVVDQGQRRTLAAAQVGLATIPVVLDDAPPAAADRLVDQFVENEHRASLTNAEWIRAVDQMALVGLSPSQIAKRTATTKRDVGLALAATASAAAVAHADQLTLEEAALLAEFEGDQAAVERMVESASRGGSLAATAERIRSDRAAAEALEARAAELAAAGLAVIDRPGHDDRSTKSLGQLLDGSKPLDEDAHTTCPGHVVWLVASWDGTISIRTGCRDWSKYGHRTYYSEGGGRAVPTDQTDAEREAARLARRHVIESNKEWKAATTVRRRWLLEFGRRRTAPSGAEALLAACLAGSWLTSGPNPYDAARQSLELLGTTREALAADLVDATPKRALQVTLAVVVASWEASVHDQLWRAEGPTQAVAARVLAAISQWGHQLSDIESRIVDGTAAHPQPAAS